MVLKWSQAPRPSPQPHLHKLLRLPLPSPASGPAINTFSIKSTGKQKKRKRRRRGRRREEDPQGVWVNPLDDTSGHEAQMCLQQRPHRHAPAHACSLITGWLFAASQAFKGARVWVQNCTSQHFDGTPAVKRDLYWTRCNLNPTQMESCWTRHGVGGMSVSWTPDIPPPGPLKIIIGGCCQG